MDGVMKTVPAVDLLIIGGGVIGCATALELARRGASVMVVDRGPLGGESSWAGGGILFPLLPWRYGSLLNRLVADSRAGYPSWIAGLQAATGGDPEYWACGMHISNPDRRAAENWLDQSQERHTWLGDDLWLPDVAQLRNPRLMSTLRLALAAQGVQVLEHTEVVGWEQRGRQITAARTAQQRLSADRFIVAAGAWSGELLAPLGARPSILPIRGQMLLYDAGSLAPPHLRVQDSTYVIPRRDGLVLVGSTLEDIGFDRRLNPDHQAALHAAGAAAWPGLRDLQPIRHWCGFRPGAPDNIPALARHPQFDNLTLHAGHFRYGVTLAPACAAILAQRLLGEVDAYPGELGWIEAAG